MILQIPPFFISVMYYGKEYKLYVTHEVLESIELFIINAKNKVIVIHSDRPLLRQNGNNKKQISWKVSNGKVGYEVFYNAVVAELARAVKSIENPPMNWTDHPKNKPY